MIDDRLIRSLTFEKLIKNLLGNNMKNESVNNYFVDEHKRKVHFDLIYDNGLDLTMIKSDLYTIGLTAVEIKFKWSNEICERVVAYAIKFKIKTLVFFTLSSLKITTKNDFINKFSEFIKILIFDKDDLKQFQEIRWLINDFDKLVLNNVNVNYYDDLKLLNKRKLSFALGAGCSLESNISNWNKLSEALGYEMIYNILDSNESAYLNMSISNTMIKGIFGDFDKTSALDAIQNYYDSESLNNQYFLYLKKVLYMSYNSPSDAQSTLVRSICDCINRYRIEELITYNFDSVLEQGLSQKYKSNTNEITNSTTNVNNSTIYHVHGYIPYDYDGKTLVNNFVFTDKEYYENAINKDNFTNSKQSYIFNNYDVVFIGVSFTDSNLKDILRQRMVERNSNTQLFAFFKLPKFEANGREKKIIEEKYKILQQSYFDTLGVKIIWVSEFDEIPGMIDDI